MPVRIALGRRVFAPSWTFTLLTILLLWAFIELGRWQWGKGQLRQAEWDQFERGTDQILDLPATQGLKDIPRFQRIRLTGRLDADHQFLLDNRTYEGHAGYEVLTALDRGGGELTLIDRGWVPFTGQRSRLPSVAFATTGPRTLVGRAAGLPAAGLASGRAPPLHDASWPKVTTYPTIEQLSGALGRRLEPQIVLLDPKEPDGYVRDWHPPGPEPIRHWSYAVQWWSFAVMLVALWFGMNLHKVPEAT
ncbi:MAG TPA: SURF1 family protein [Steroidobacteraceae bacterium]|nr:SURF1 family protein [Steroidobacteraceae bacterium]